MFLSNILKFPQNIKIFIIIGLHTWYNITCKKISTDYDDKTSEYDKYKYTVIKNAPHILYMYTCILYVYKDEKTEYDKN